MRFFVVMFSCPEMQVVSVSYFPEEKEEVHHCKMWPQHHLVKPNNLHSRAQD